MCIGCIGDLHSLKEEVENLSQKTESLHTTSSPLLIHPNIPTNARANGGFPPLKTNEGLVSD